MRINSDINYFCNIVTKYIVKNRHIIHNLLFDIHYAKNKNILVGMF